VLVERGPCPTHARALEHGRPNWDGRRRYRSTRWALTRAAILHRDPVCTDCRNAVSADVHHKQKPGPADDDPLFWAESNLAGLCAPCHKIRTARGE
jgi:5-methylcytosine-specific restriction endonuclease McrA